MDKTQVHLWSLDLRLAGSLAAGLEKILSPSEKSRAEKFKFAEHRTKYIAAHGALRQILAAYLEIDPSAVEFTEGPHGKPDLISTSRPLPLRFNLSHSHDAALIAVTRGRQLGVDVEHIKRDFAWPEIAERFFSAAEVAKLRHVAPELQQRAFFVCWTRKEAYIKAKGGGLSIPLQDFEVSLAPGEPPALLVHRDDPEEVNRWRLAEIEVGPDYAAALSVEGRDWNLRSFRWQGTSPLTTSRK